MCAFVIVTAQKVQGTYGSVFYLRHTKLKMTYKACQAFWMSPSLKEQFAIFF